MNRTAAIEKKSRLADFFLIFFPSYFVYLLTLYPTVGTEDSGELIVSAAIPDIAHPPGYPLHTLLGKLFTVLIPFGNIGWRVNLMSTFFGAVTVTILYFIVKRLAKNDLLALATGLFFAFTDIFWSQSIRTETYALNSFFLALIMYLLLLWDQTGKNKYLALAALSLGLSLANHHLMFLAGLPILIFVLIKNWHIIIEPKIVAICSLLFVLGLSVYVYLPIRTALGPYDNPAYIKHEGLYTWDTFFGFVNRKIYGGTVSLHSEETSETTQPPNPAVELMVEYGGKWLNGNLQGFFPMLKILFEQLLLLPLFLLVPGVYFLIAMHKKFAVLVFLLFFFYTSIQLIFIGVGPGLHPFTAFSNRPFYISSIMILAIICGAGMRLLVGFLKNRKYRRRIITAAVFLPIIPLTMNFSANNESNNYIAYDFNRHLLESLPPDSYLLSTGRDNFTFPLYYLRKIDHVRPDVDLEIYYRRTCLTQSDLEDKLREKNKSVVFIDLLPCDYGNLGLVPYNFAYAYGDTKNLPPAGNNEFPLRGLRKEMDYPNSKLKGLYYLKMALLNSEYSQKMEEYFSRIKVETGGNEQLTNFITDYKAGTFATGMF